MKQKDFFENFLASGFGEIILFYFWYNNIKIGAFWCQSNVDTAFGVQSISVLFFMRICELCRRFKFLKVHLNLQ
jgi:hypothetical protein